MGTDYLSRLSLEQDGVQLWLPDPVQAAKAAVVPGGESVAMGGL